MESKYRRRNISGVYIFHKFEDEEKRQPTCFEDCPEEKQEEWLNNIRHESAKRVAKLLLNKSKNNYLDCVIK